MKHDSSRALICQEPKIDKNEELSFAAELHTTNTPRVLRQVETHILLSDQVIQDLSVHFVQLGTLEVLFIL